MAELRYNPMIKDWVMIASNRQNRPQMPKDWCPFCPGSGKVPDSYEVYAYDNDFPALTQNPPEPDDVATEFYKVKPSHGKCEVILFSPDHHGTLKELSDAHMKKLVDLWCERFNAMREDKKIKYVFIFENRGDVVGVTMPHPHGQMYGYSVLPKKIELELDAAKEHFDEQVSEETIARLSTIPEFVRAYEIGGLDESEFIRFGASQRTLSQFVEAGWGMIVSFKL